MSSSSPLLISSRSLTYVRCKYSPEILFRAVSGREQQFSGDGIKAKKRFNSDNQIDLDLESFGVSDLERERERGARGLGGEAVTPASRPPPMISSSVLPTSFCLFSTPPTFGYCVTISIIVSPIFQLKILPMKIGVVDVAVETTKFQIGECGGGCGGEAVVVSVKHLRHCNPNWLMAMLTDNLELCTGVWRLLIGLLEWSDVVGVLELVSSSGPVEVRSSSPRGRELEVTVVARRSKTQIR
nr:hypothetical protein Iba_chr04cCG15560 [Ipomoea batatas]